MQPVINLDRGRGEEEEFKCELHNRWREEWHGKTPTKGQSNWSFRNPYWQIWNESHVYKYGRPYIWRL